MLLTLHVSTRVFVMVLVEFGPVVEMVDCAATSPVNPKTNPDKDAAAMLKARRIRGRLIVPSLNCLASLKQFHYTAIHHIGSVNIIAKS